MCLCLYVHPHEHGRELAQRKLKKFLLEWPLGHYEYK